MYKKSPIALPLLFSDSHVKYRNANKRRFFKGIFCLQIFIVLQQYEKK